MIKRVVLMQANQPTASMRPTSHTTRIAIPSNARSYWPSLQIPLLMAKARRMEYEDSTGTISSSLKCPKNISDGDE